MTGPVLAGITNGFFTNGLDGWTVEPADSSQIYAGSGFAVLKEELWGSTPLRISQVFFVEEQDEVLSFDLKITTGPGGGETDYFKMIMYTCEDDGDRIGTEFIDTIWDSTQGEIDPSQTFPPYVLSDLDGQSDYVYLAFELNPDGLVGNPITNVTISNVITTQQAYMVPVPGALMLGAIGLGLVAVHKKRILK